MQVQKIAAFSDGDVGGNPAGVLIADQFPSDSEMQKIAADVGFSETAFAVQAGADWRVRYFSPESNDRTGCCTRNAAGRWRVFFAVESSQDHS